ncbi:tetraspanin-1-like [Aulostomus maculatus]
MVAGIWVKVDSDSMVDILSNLDAPEELSQVLSVGYLLIALGPMVLIIGLIGCCGAVRGSRFKLMVFFIIVFLVFVAEVAGVVASLVLKTDNLGSAIVTVIKENYGKQDEVTGPLDILQCCGVNSFSDFTFSSYHNTTQLYPPHCCKSDNPCAIEDVDQDKIGCYTVIKNKIKNNQWCVVAALVGIVILETAIDWSVMVNWLGTLRLEAVHLPLCLKQSVNEFWFLVSSTS